MKGNRHRLFTAVLIFFAALLSSLLSSNGVTKTCVPTGPDVLGPFYEPGAPVRSTVGKGYILSGVVMSSKDCTTIKGARIEFWLVGPDGRYDDDHRATVYSDSSGSYKFESNYPRPYVGRPSHIHLRVSAEGFKTLVTQHYPEKGRIEATFDLVLIPSKE